MRVTFTKFPLLRYKFYLTNFLSDKLLTTTIATGMPKNLYTEILSDFEQFFLVTTNFVCIF